MDSRLAGRPVLKPSRCIALCNYIYSIENNELIIWNILFMAPRIKIIVIKTYMGAVVVKRCEVSTCYDRSKSKTCVTKICRNRSKRRIVSQQPLQSKF